MSFSYSQSVLKSSITLVLTAGVMAFQPVVAQAWTKTVLDVTEAEVDLDGYPVLDQFSNLVMDVPKGFRPSLLDTSVGLKVLRADSSFYADPPIYDEFGFPYAGDYAQLSVATLNAGSWALNDTFSSQLEGILNPRFVSRFDDQVSVYFWKDYLLCVDTLIAPSKTRVTLPIPAFKGAVAIDENGGLHALSINANYELWHSYYAGAGLTQTKLSSGPVCDVSIAAGEGDVCHVVYSTFSEDYNRNGVLDMYEGEDINWNSVLDVADYQLVYRELDATSAGVEELVVEDTILKLCYFDLLFSVADGLKLAYANPVENSVYLAERSESWTSTRISAIADKYGAVAIDQFPDGDTVISAVTQDGTKLLFWEENSSYWDESLISQSATLNYFRETDVVVRDSGQIIVAAYEQDPAYLTAYTQETLPALASVNELIVPIDIRSAFIVTWPTPQENSTRQMLQCKDDLSDPYGWVTIEQRYSFYGNWDMAKETTVEHDSGQKFYRVVEISD